MYFGGDVLDGARMKAGLTNREVWEALGVGETTWMRWKRSGYVPIEKLSELVLFLELEEPEGLDESVPRTAWEMLRLAQRENAAFERLEARLRRIEEHLGLQDVPRSA